APHCVDELVDVHDPVFEQVAGAAASIGEQLGRVAVFDVLRDDEHCRLGETFAELECSAEALVTKGGWQADVDDRNVRLVVADGVDERVAVCDCGGDVEAVVAEQACEPVAQQGKVLGDHDAHGSSALIVVGPPCGLAIASVPSSASTRRLSPVRPLPDASAPPRPSSATSTSSREARMRIRIFTPAPTPSLLAS